MVMMGIPGGGGGGSGCGNRAIMYPDCATGGNTCLCSSHDRTTQKVMEDLMTALELPCMLSGANTESIVQDAPIDSMFQSC